MPSDISVPVEQTFSVGRAVIAVVLVAGFAGVLLAMGRSPICPCGTIELWHGAANDSGTSQHIADWYSLSHIIHGFIFFWIAAWVFGRLNRPLPIATVLIAAIFVEGCWELLENSPMIIERYRATTVSDTYFGDSVLNSVADIGFMIVGFTIARMTPGWIVVLAAIAMELVALYVIRDNLTLNILMIVHPLDAIKAWQAAR